MNITIWKDLMAGGSKNTAKVISQMLDQLKALDEDEYLNQVTSISARQKDLKKKVIEEEISEDNARVAQNKINKAVLFTLDELDDEGILAVEELEEEAKEIPTGIAETPSVGAAKSLDELKKIAIDRKNLLFSLQSEKEMTMPGKAEVILERQIEEAEKAYEEAKEKVRSFNS